MKLATNCLIYALAITLLFGTVPAEAAQVDAAEEPTDPMTIWAGVFSEDQAERGGRAYGAFCSSCHRDDLSGYDAVLKGVRFMDRWREDSLDSLFVNIRNTMPRGEPGSLSADTYLDVVAYLLQENGFPPGVADLNADTLESIRVVGREGPAPLPNGALVEVYGCLARTLEGTWVLSEATLPVRTRNPASSSDEELSIARDARTGTLTHHLKDAQFYGAQGHEGHKMEAKGFLTDEPTEGIAITSLTMVSEACP